MNILKRGCSWLKRKALIVASVVVIGVAVSITGIQQLGRFEFRIGESLVFGTFTAPTIETENILLVAGVVFTALAAIWFIHKAVKLINRS